MTTESDPPRTRLLTVTPTLPVADLARGLRYYHYTLGFELGWLRGTPPNTAMVYRDSVEIELVQQDAATPIGPCRVTIHVDNVDDLFDECTRRSAFAAAPPSNDEDGWRGFVVHDLDGHELRFGCQLVL